MVNSRSFVVIKTTDQHTHKAALFFARILWVLVVAFDEREKQMHSSNL